MAEKTTGGRGVPDDLPLIDVHHTGPGCAEVTIQESAACPRIVNVVVKEPSGRELRYPVPLDEFATQLRDLDLRHPRPAKFFIWFPDSIDFDADGRIVRPHRRPLHRHSISLNDHHDLQALIPLIWTFVVRVMERQRQGNFRSARPLSAPELFTEVLLLVRNAAPGPPGGPRTRLREALGVILAKIEKRTGRPRKLSLADAVEILRRDRQPLPPTNHPWVSWALDPLLRDPTVIDRLADEERPAWAGIVRSMIAALGAGRGRQTDARRDALGRDLKTLALEQAGAPLLYVECEAIVDAALDGPSRPQRGRPGERLRKRLARLPAVT